MSYKKACLDCGEQFTVYTRGGAKFKEKCYKCSYEDWKKEGADVKAQKVAIEDHMKIIEQSKNTCEILKEHSEMLKNDPNRLSSKFLQKLIKVECKDGLE